MKDLKQLDRYCWYDENTKQISIGIEDEEIISMLYGGATLDIMGFQINVYGEGGFRDFVKMTCRVNGKLFGYNVAVERYKRTYPEKLVASQIRTGGFSAIVTEYTKVEKFETMEVDEHTFIIKFKEGLVDFLKDLNNKRQVKRDDSSNPA